MSSHHHSHARDYRHDPSDSADTSVDTDNDIEAQAALEMKSLINKPGDTNGLTSIISGSADTSATELPETLPCLCFDLIRLSPSWRFAMLSTGVFFFFLLNSSVEEFTFKQLKDFHYGWYLTFFELLCFSVFAVLDRLFLSHEPILAHNASFKQHGIVAAAMTASRGLTNVSLQFLSYPTQIIFKSMKLITVMIGSLVMLKASFTIYEYLTALSLVIAAIMFSFGDADSSGKHSVSDSKANDKLFQGIIIVLFSLVGDALHSTTQDKLLRQFQSTTSECMLFTNLFASLASLVYIIYTGELFAALAYCSLYPIAYVLFVVRSAVIYLGVLCFILLIKSSGVVVATGVTTVRKILSILLSFIVFPKVWSNKYLFGGLFFVASLLLTYYDSKIKQDKKMEEKKARAYQASLQK